MFECTSCANRHSPLCMLCSQIVAPDGTERRPKHYVELIEPRGVDKRPLDVPRGEDCARMIEGYLRAGVPVPVALVMEYNKFAE